MLVDTREMLERAQKRRCAVGAFNFFNMESAQAIVAAAEAEREAVILQVWSGFDPAPGMDMLTAVGCAAAEKAKVPVAVHLDHGATLAQLGHAVRAGMRSVMLDGSALPFAENVAVTKLAVDFCREADIPVEGEIGHVGSEAGGEGDCAVYTDPEEAAAFCQATGISACAVSIGTMHGAYGAAKPALDIALLSRIRACVSVPLVLHGSSYTPEEQLAAAVRAGICKVNVATEINDTLLAETRALLAAGGKMRYAGELTGKPYAAVTELVRHKIRLFAGK